MGWTVLYIAFGIVALWLLGEVLLQYKARLRWRLVAFFGFLGVVVGVVIPSVPVIAAGTAAFATGQTFVTLSFRRGFSTGWALGGKPGESRRRRAEPADAPPTLEVSGMEEAPQPPLPPADLPPPPERPAGPPPPQAYQPEPMPDETGEYAAYHGQPPAAPSGFDPLGAAPFATDGQPYAGVSGEQRGSDPTLGPYADGYGYGDQFSAYSDPYVGGTGTSGTPYDPYQDPYSDHDRYAFAPGEPDQHQYADPYATSDPLTGGYPTQGYDPGGQGYDPYSAAAQPGYAQTPPGGVWVPPQRDGQSTGGYPTGPTGQADPGYGYPDGYGYPEGYAAGGYQADGYQPGYPSGYPEGYATGEYQPEGYADGTAARAPYPGQPGDYPAPGYPDAYQPGYPDGDGYSYGEQQRY